MAHNERRTVVGHDGSRSARAALDWAATDAAHRDSELHVLHVAQWGRAQRASQELLTEALARVRTRAPEVPVTLETMWSGTGRSLVEASCNAELIVLGVPEGPGSTASAVVAQAHCPVVLVGPGAADGSGEGTGSPSPIAVAYDGSQRALCFAAERALRQEVPLIVMVAGDRALGEAALQRLRHSFPGVQADYELQPGTTLPATAPAGCGLLVVAASPDDVLLAQTRTPLAVVH